MQNKSSKFEIEFLKKEKESLDAFSFYFKRPKNFNFISGQYLKLFLEIKNPDERGSSRYFTISSSPTDKEYLTITTRIIKSSFKLKLNSLNTGEKLIISGPIGYFDFDSENSSENIFIAGGIGVTPYHSILRYIDAKKIISKIILFASFASKEDVLFFDEFKKIEKSNSKIKIVYSLTKEKNLYPDFETGRITLDMIKKYVQDYNKSKFFITGSYAMVEAAFEMIRDSGTPEENIFKEDFPGY